MQNKSIDPNLKSHSFHLQFQFDDQHVFSHPGAASDVTPAHPTGSEQEAVPSSSPPAAAPAQDGRGGRGQATH